MKRTLTIQPCNWADNMHISPLSILRAILARTVIKK
nr:MAG TPA: hypothetical protein [Siphoviridae sp. ctRJB2]